MQVTLKNEAENEISMELVIPAEEAAQAYNKAATAISQHVNIPGFRKGKAPRAIVEKFVGAERIKMEAVEHIAPKMIAQAVEENKLDLISQPAIKSYDYEVGKDMTLQISLEAKPEVVLGDYKGLSLKVQDTPYSEEQEQKAIENLLKQNSTMEIVTGRAASDKDVAVIDFDGYVNGEKIQGGEGKKYPLDLGNSNFIPGFAEQIVGKNIDDEFEINVNFPENYHDEKLKGQPAVFKIKLHEIKERKMPELNDEFVQKLGQFKTVDELKADVKKHLEAQRENINIQNKENELFKTIIDSSKVDIPEKLINREIETLKEEYKQRLAYQGIDWDTFMKSQNEEEMMKNLREDAQARIKNSLVIDKIAQVEEIKLEPSDLQQKFAQLSAMYGMNPNDLMKELGHSAVALSSLSQQALNDKVKDYLLANNNVELVASK